MKRLIKVGIHSACGLLVLLIIAVAFLISRIPSRGQIKSYLTSAIEAPAGKGTTATKIEPKTEQSKSITSEFRSVEATPMQQNTVRK